MRSIIIIMAILLTGIGHIPAQNPDAILLAVEKNNTALSAARKLADAQQISYHTGLLPQNPEIGFNYLWGSPAVIGDRIDISATQTFDFPTAYYFKGKMADAKSMQAELEFLKQRNTVLLQARTLYTELIFSNIMAAVMKRRLDNAMNLALSYKTKFSLNECGIIEYNKAQLNLIATEKQNSLLELKRESLQAELNALNGGQPIPVTDTAYPAIIINPDFEQWYAQAEAKSPVLTWLKKEIEISRSQIKLNAASVLPKLTAGYMSEQVAGEQFQGITLGITIPLWENRNMVRYAKTYAVAAQSAEADQRLMFYNRLKTQHALVLAMMKQVEDYRTSMNLYSNAVLLKKSLDGGELSLIEYLNELILYYQNYEILLDAEKEMQLKNDELLQYVY